MVLKNFQIFFSGAFLGTIFGVFLGVSSVLYYIHKKIFKQEHYVDKLPKGVKAICETDEDNKCQACIDADLKGIQRMTTLITLTFKKLYKDDGYIAVKSGSLVYKIGIAIFIFIVIISLFYTAKLIVTIQQIKRPRSIISFVVFLFY